MAEYLDIEDLVREAKSDLGNIGTAALVAGMIAEWPELVTSEIGMELAKFAAAYAVKILIENGEFFAFLLNSDFLTSEQAADYRDKVAKRLQAPDDISDEDWEKLEREKIDAFRALGNFTR